MTVGCARCHNHKFDPIPQKDYYRMQAVFVPAKPNEYPLVGDDEVKHVQSRAEAFRSDLQAPWKEQMKQLEQPYRDRLMAEKKAKLPDYIQLALRTPPEKRTEGQKLNAIQVEKTLDDRAEGCCLAALSPEDLRASQGTDRQDQGDRRASGRNRSPRRCRSPSRAAKLLRRTSCTAAVRDRRAA